MPWALLLLTPPPSPPPPIPVLISSEASLGTAVCEGGRGKASRRAGRKSSHLSLASRRRPQVPVERKTIGFIPFSAALAVSRENPRKMPSFTSPSHPPGLLQARATSRYSHATRLLPSRHHHPLLTPGHFRPRSRLAFRGHGTAGGRRSEE